MYTAVHPFCISTHFTHSHIHSFTHYLCHSITKSLNVLKFTPFDLSLIHSVTHSICHSITQCPAVHPFAFHFNYVFLNFSFTSFFSVFPPSHLIFILGLSGLSSSFFPLFSPTSILPPLPLLSLFIFLSPFPLLSFYFVPTPSISLSL